MQSNLCCKLGRSCLRFQTIQRMIAGVLPMVPIEKVHEAFYWIIASIENEGAFEEEKEEVKALLEYVKETWVGCWEGDEYGNWRQVKLPR